MAVMFYFSSACSDEHEVPFISQHQENEGITEFDIPDSIQVERELVIAAYQQIHPAKACVIFAFSDTTRSTVKKYSYSIDSIFEVKELVKVSYDEYKIKDESSESYIVKPKTVVWIHQNGNSAVTAEYNRIDQQK